MSAHVETFYHALCYECDWEEQSHWLTDARELADAHNATHHPEGRELK